MTILIYRSELTIIQRSVGCGKLPVPVQDPLWEMKKLGCLLKGITDPLTKDFVEYQDRLLEEIRELTKIDMPGK